MYDGNQNLPPFGGFGGGQLDAVSLQNGNLHLHIPLASWPQRGGKTVWLAYEFDSPSWSRQTTEMTVAGRKYYSTTITPNPFRVGPQSNLGAWSVYSPSVQMYCGSLGGIANLWNQYTVTDPEGVKHPLYMTTSSNNCFGTQTQSPTADGSGMMVNIGSNPPTITLRDGTQIVLNTSLFASTEEDTNGNLMGTADTLDRTLWTTTKGSTTTLTTPLGVKVSAPSYTLYTVNDSNGNSQNFTVTYTAIDVASQNFCTGYNRPPYYTCTEYSGAEAVPSKLTFPNGAVYQFSWVDSTPAELQSIALPTGGSISYTYGTGCLTGPGGATCRALVGGRTVSVNGANNTWTYSGGSPGSATVTDPLGNQQVHVFSYVTSGSYQSVSTVETQVSYYQGSATSGKLLRQVVTAYTGEPNPYDGNVANIRPTSVTTTLDNGLVTQSQTDYETFTSLELTWTRLNPTEIREYDYASGAPGPLLRRTDYTYLHNSNSADLNLNIVDRPLTITVYNGAGTMISETQNEYDNYTAGIQASGAVQHDTARGSSYLTRGNVTAVERWRNTDGTWLTIRNQYDDAGNVLTQTDPLSHSTTFSYADSWASGGSTCAPSGGQTKAFPTLLTNALNQPTSYSYFSCTGLQGSVTDPNNQPTSYSFDMLGRATQVTYPDTGQTTYCYTDEGGSTCSASGPPYSIVSTEKISSSQNLVTTGVFDGLGRPSQNQLNSDNGGTDYTVTTYDAIGRVASVTNPYRSGNTIYTTSYGYDALNRRTQVTDADGSIATVSYTGNCATSTDEAGKTKKGCADGLGRVTQVTENPGGLGYVTTYGYDALNDLTSVVQDGSRTRTFAYNSLSELLSAANPESGTTCYGTVSSNVCQNNGYDANGNSIYKTDARGTRTTKSYDALYRLTERQYSDGTSTVYFNYDGNTQTGCTTSITDTYPKERQTGMCDAGGSEAWSHDPMGRVLTDRRTTNGVTNSTVYAYSPFVDGSTYKITYPSGLAITYAYDTAGRPISATDSNGNSYASAVTYAPQGALQSATMDATSKFAGFTVSNTYTNRLQPNEMKVVNSSSTVMDFSDCFYALSGGACPSTGTTDNGNVMAVLNNMDSTRSQIFSYDALNRISIGGTVNNTGTNCWGEQYGYDAWGNLLTMAFPSGQYNSSCAQPDSLSVGVGTNNQINSPSGYLYDLAGNLTALPSGTASYAYNAENQITSTASVSYVYDGDGKRVEKNNGTLYWYGVSGDVLEETSLAGALTSDYVFFRGQRIAKRDASGNIFAYFADHLGSSRKVEEIASGGNTASLSYDADFYPFARAHEFVNTTDPIYKFTGKQRDAESGLDYFNARHYNSAIGRFMSPDPYNFAGFTRMDDPQSWNGYSYARNNPLSVVDPTGMGYCQWSVKDGVEDRDPSPSDGGADQADCTSEEAGGTWVQEAGDPQQITNDSGDTAVITTPGTTVTVNGDTGDSSSYSYGGTVIPQPEFYVLTDRDKFEVFHLAGVEASHDLGCVVTAQAQLIPVVGMFIPDPKGSESPAALDSADKALDAIDAANKFGPSAKTVARGLSAIEMPNIGDEAAQYGPKAANLAEKIAPVGTVVGAVNGLVYINSCLDGGGKQH